jgi:hypothetical protein
VQGSELLEKVLIPIAEELHLPIALKLGAQRGVNPLLRTGGVSRWDTGLAIVQNTKGRGEELEASVGMCLLPPPGPGHGIAWQALHWGAKALIDAVLC